MKRIFGPSVRMRNQLEHLAVTAIPIEILAEERCAVEVPRYVENRAGVGIGSILITRKHMEHALSPFALCTKRQLEDVAIVSASSPVQRRRDGQPNRMSRGRSAGIRRTDRRKVKITCSFQVPSEWRRQLENDAAVRSCPVAAVSCTAGSVDATPYRLPTASKVSFPAQRINSVLAAREAMEHSLGPGSARSSVSACTPLRPRKRRRPRCAIESAGGVEDHPSEGICPVGTTRETIKHAFGPCSIRVRHQLVDDASGVIAPEHGGTV